MSSPKGLGRRSSALRFSIGSADLALAQGIFWIGHTTDRFRQRATGFPEYPFHRGGSCRIPNSLKEWDAKGSDAVTAIVQNRKRNIDYPLYLITFSLVKSALFNLGQVSAEIARRARSIVLTPELYNPGRDFGDLVRQDYLSCCRTHEVANATGFHVKAAAAERRIGLGDDYDPVSVEHSQMARLVDLTRHMLHDRQGFGSQALNWGMLICQLEKMQG